MDNNTSPTSSTFSTLSWGDPDWLLTQQMLEAKDGIMIFQDFSPSAPIASMRETFCKLYENPEIGQKLNKLNPTRGIFKNNAFMNKNIDQKIILDLSHTRLRYLLDTNKELVLELGNEFMDVVEFCSTMTRSVIPRLVDLVSNVIAGGNSGNSKQGVKRVACAHYGLNYNFRFTDYFPVHRNAQRCSEHRDYSTFTLIFQDKMQGGLEVHQNGQWVPVPKESEVVLMWGWSAFLLSNGRIHAPLHRVVPMKNDRFGKAPRRNEIAVFVAPDLDAYIYPILIQPNESYSFKYEAIQDLTVKKFKSLFSLKWHQREGTTSTEEENELKQRGHCSLTQDDEVIDYLMGTCTRTRLE